MDRGRSIHVPAFFQIVFGNQAKTRLETFVILLTQVFDESQVLLLTTMELVVEAFITLQPLSPCVVGPCHCTG